MSPAVFVFAPSEATPMLPAAISKLIQTLPKTRVPAGQQMFHQGDSCQQYFILTAGQARIFTRASNGKEVILYQVCPGDICVLTTACLLGNEAFPAEAIAETELELRRLSKLEFEHLLDTNSDFRHFVFQGFGKRMNSLIATVQKLALETIEQRLAKHLLLQAHNPIEITHQAIAEQIGSAREVVSRHLKRFESKGLLQLGRGQIHLLDRSSLLALT